MTTPGGNTSFSVNQPSSEAGPKDSEGDHSLLYDNKNPDPSANQDTTIINDPDLTYHHKKKALIQQTLHRTFPNRPRSNSCSGTSTANQGSAVASKLELPPTRDFSTTKESRSQNEVTSDTVETDLTQNQEAGTWQTNQTRKRTRESPENACKNLKQPKSDRSYWLNAPVLTSNRFSALDADNAALEVPTRETETSITIKPIKPPPIFIDDVTNIQPLTKLLNEVVNTEYELKVISSTQVKVQPKTTQAYTIITKELQIRKTEFHTYKLK